MKNIEPRNSKNQYHGYQEWHYNNELYYRANYKNDKPIGYEEYHSTNKTTFNIK